MDSQAIEAAAGRWFEKRHSGTWTDADQAQFDAWREQSTAHRIAYIRLEAAWRHAARMCALGAGVPRGVVPPRGSWGGGARSFKGGSASNPASADDDEIEPIGQRDTEPDTGTPGPRVPVADSERSWKKPLFALAASLLIAIIAGGVYRHTDLLRAERYATPVGGLNNVLLTDGSRVTLNTDSRIRVNLQAHERRIALNKGEAFFEVFADPSRPFVVEVADKRIVAVGTKFSVRRDDEDVQVVVTEGKVRIENGAANASGSATAPVLLTAGGIAQTARDQVMVHHVAKVEAERRMSWRSGYVVFRDTELADAVAELNRYNDRQIVIADPAVASLRIGGNFRPTNTEAFLWLLRTGLPVNVEEHEDEVILKSR